MKDFPVGSYIVMNSTPRVPGFIPQMDIGYKYNYGKVLVLLIPRGVEVLNKVFPIYLVSLTFILMFLFALLVSLACLEGISMPVIK